MEVEQPPDPDKGSQEASTNLEGGTWEAPPDTEEGTQEALPDTEEQTREAQLGSGKETREVPSDRKEETQAAPSDPEEETREAPSHSEKETQEPPSDSVEERQDVAGLAAGSTHSEGLVVPARRKLTMGRNLPQNKFSRTWNRRVHAGVKGSAPQIFLLTNEEGDEKSVSNRKQAINALEIEEWRKVRRKKKCKVA